MINVWACGPCNIERHEDCPGEIERVVDGRLAMVECQCARDGHQRGDHDG